MNTNNTIIGEESDTDNRRSLEFGLAPKGGGAFFLAKILGVSRAYKIMLAEEDITAHEALKLGIVDEVVPFDELRDAAFKTAEQFARKPARSLRCCKRLLNYSLKDLREYLEFETQELVNLIGPGIDRIDFSGITPRQQPAHDKRPPGTRPL